VYCRHKQGHLQVLWQRKRSALINEPTSRFWIYRKAGSRQFSGVKYFVQIIKIQLCTAATQPILSTQIQLHSLPTWQSGLTARGLVRKQELVRLFGGECQGCGYSKNIHALSFHHLNPAEKTMSLSLRSLSNNSWDTITAETSKCKLLCLNCHSEVHNCHEH